ncbi:MAG TPA: bifunctional copper resistance protein CopD/cytochrome c oxidase assembly protein [Kineosporiaceae bacterium]|nr:bifunctional copper resistance protein CopD/cytochrome c oxidase assembly protein [Kineosporiaceae bacterium]
MTTAAAKTGAAAEVPLPDGPLLMAGYLLAALVTTAVATWFTGAVAPSVLADPGVLVRWGLPLVRVVGDLTQSLTIGLLVLACVALPVGKPRKAYAPALRAASLTAGVWAVAMLADAILTYADVSGQPMNDPTYGQQLASFLRDIDLGRGIAFVGLAAALIATLAAGATTLGSSGLLLLLALISLIPPALAGHAAGSSDHETAVTSLGFHLLGVTVWVGALAGLVCLWGGLSDRALGTAARRFSYIALWCFAVVAASGVVNGWLRIGGLDGLDSRYGAVLIGKVLLLVALGVMGWRHRTHTLPQIEAGRPRAFARLAAVEAAVMMLAVGLGVTLSVSAPPPPALLTEAPGLLTKAPGPAQALTGYPLPPSPSPLHYLDVWQPDLLWMVLVGLGAVMYAVGVLRLHRRGDGWHVGRTICWYIGLGILAYVTCGPPAAYGRVQFSAHMIAHMTIGMAVPLFLVLGAPVTLALRVLHPRRDGSRGAREWLLATVECGYMRFLSNPVVVIINFGFSLTLFYYSNLFRLALTTHVGHELMHVHFLFAGYLLAWVMIGVDPGPKRPSHPLRLVTLFVTLSFHSFFGVSLMMSNRLLAPDFFGALGRTWGGTLLEDQKLGGGIAWGIGELPTLALALILAVQWTRSDDREARRRDRAADRDGDAELNAYNAMLAQLAQADARQARTERPPAPRDVEE